MRAIHVTLSAVVGLALAAHEAAGQLHAAAVIPHPAWDCGMPEGIPNPENGSLIFELEVPLDRVAEIGRTPFGSRRVAVGLEGSVVGPKLAAKVMEGGLDFELTLPNGTIEIEQILVLEAMDGTYILVRNAGTGAAVGDVRIVMDFEAPAATEHAWLNSGKFVGRRELNALAGTMTLRVYDVSGVPVSTGAVIRIDKPADIPAQPWDYREKAETEIEGGTLITENVTLGSSQSVGESKRGRRNIIPITGGQVSGRITGKILMGGADYQNLSAPATIDARYLWETDDGEIIIVRNGGSFGSLAPSFEARLDGPYAYLNTGLYLSSNPGMGQGGVALTFYESAD